MAEEVVEAEAIEEPAGPAREGEPDVRPLPERRPAVELDAWRGEARAVAIAAAGGLAAGAATAVAISAIKAKRGGGTAKRIVRRARGEEEGILASRSFRVDVHLLDR